MNWTGSGVVFPRERWKDHRGHPAFSRTGVYVLVGYREGDEELPSLYVGEGDVVRDRIDTHFGGKDFWSHGYVFTASSGGLNKAHVRWLERELIQQATRAGRSRLDNGTAPPEPPLSEAERADLRAFLREILQVLPIMGLAAFEVPRPVSVPRPSSPSASGDVTRAAPDDVVVVVPANEEGFQQVFLGEKRWRAIRIADAELPLIRYITAYRTSPLSQVTHHAPVAEIKPYGEGGKYELIFSEAAIEIKPIPLGSAPGWIVQNTRYTTVKPLNSAKSLTELFPDRGLPPP